MVGEDDLTISENIQLSSDDSSSSEDDLPISSKGNINNN